LQETLRYIVQTGTLQVATVSNNAASSRTGVPAAAAAAAVHGYISDDRQPDAVVIGRRGRSAAIVAVLYDQLFPSRQHTEHSRQS